MSLKANIEKGIWIQGDKDKLKQVLLNLFSNAIDFTNAGGTIALSIKQSKNTIHFTLTDTGIGIPQKSLPNIFERFYRIDQSRNRKTGGAGIGLAIVKSIVDAHGGAIRAMSQEGKGTTFRILLPKAGGSVRVQR